MPSPRDERVLANGPLGPPAGQYDFMCENIGWCVFVVWLLGIGCMICGNNYPTVSHGLSLRFFDFDSLIFFHFFCKFTDKNTILLMIYGEIYKM